MNKIVFAILVGVVTSVATHYALRSVEPIFVATLPDGGSYAGDLNAGRLHGDGEVHWENQSYYKGEFVDGLFHGKGEYRFANGAVYKGNFVAGEMDGYGELFTVVGDIYQGEFKQGVFSGQGKYKSKQYTYSGGFRTGKYHGHGEIVYTKGGRYLGEFKRGEFHGQGLFENSDGATYTGEFKNGQFTGQGTHKDKNSGATYVGEFIDWKYDGEGVFTSIDGDQYQGVFTAGRLSGEGEFNGVNGEHYSGVFDNWLYSGEGRLKNYEGDVYEGYFSMGLFHGDGVLEYAEPIDEVERVTGRWQRGNLVEAQNPMLVYDKQEAVEWALYNQVAMVERQLEQLAQNNPQQQELYFVGIAGDGAQEVFRREINYVKSLMEFRFTDSDRTILLSNSKRTYRQLPLATRESLKQTLHGVAKKMDRENDILFLYLTSHGSRDHELMLNQNGFALADFSAVELGGLLKELNIKNKVVVVSACYSGGFIEHLEDEQSLIITAARKDRTSFGCSDRNDFTYFGRAYFKEGLAKGMGFIEAFEQAKVLVTQWEEEQEITPSEPQINSSNSVAEALDQWSLSFNKVYEPDTEEQTATTQAYRTRQYSLMREIESRILF